MPSCTILTYHMIDAPRAASEAPYCCDPRSFAAQMRYLRESGYTVIGMPALLDCIDGRSPWPARAVAITFDDGVSCCHERALPILAEHGLPATVFVISGLLDSDNEWMVAEGHPRRRMLTRAELAALDRAGIEIGSHTRRHVRLGRAPAAEIASELRESKAQLEDLLAKPVRFFAYPYGSFDARARDAVEAAGYLAACSTIQGRNRPATDRFVLRRVAVDGGDTLAQFRAKLWLGSSARTHLRAAARALLARAGLLPPKSYA
ncbi:MAG: polysaccharide deacetylase family protein [Burkholderiales bacterium]